MGKVIYVEPDGITNKQEIVFDDEFSFKNFAGNPKVYGEWSNKVIYASNFSQEDLNNDLFPEGTKNVTFVQCNLDNVNLPKGSIVIGGSQRKFQAQNDLNDWLIDENLEPTMPIDHKQFTKRGLPIPTPAEIPSVKVEKPIDWIKVKEEANVTEN